jgi:hypothetical protein
MWVLFESFGADFITDVEPGLTQADVEQIDKELRDVGVAVLLGVSEAASELPRLVTAVELTDGSIAQTVFGEADVFVLYFPEGLADDTWVGRLLGHAIEPGFMFLRAEEDDTAENDAAAERFDCSAQRFREAFAEIGPDDTARISLGDRPPPDDSEPPDPACE